MHAISVHATPRRLALAAALVAALASQQFAVAQPVAPGQPQNFSYQENVFVEHDGGINGTMKGLVMNFVSDQLEAQAKAANGGDYPWPHHVEFEAMSGDESLPQRVYYLKVMWAGESYSEDDGKRFWEAARKEVEKRLRVVQKQTHDGRAQQWIVQQQRIQRDYDNARVRLQEITNEMMIKGDARGIEQVRGELQELVAQQRQLELQQVGVKARRQAIEARIDELREVAAKEIDGDPILREMRALVEIQERRLKAVNLDAIATLTSEIDHLKQMMELIAAQAADSQHRAQIDSQLRRKEEKLAKLQEEGDSSESTNPAFQEANSDLIEARIALLKAQRDAAERVQGSALGELNSELSTLIIETAELDEKSKALSEMVNKLQEHASPDNVADVELLERERRDAQDEVSNLRKQLRNHETQRPGDLEQITIRPLEAALFGDDAEAADAEESADAAEASR
jgi:hypothetical protein